MTTIGPTRTIIIVIVSIMVIFMHIYKYIIFYLAPTCMEYISSILEYALQRIYVQDHLDPGHKKQVTSFIHRIENSFVELIDENQWLESKTKERAIKKIESMTEYIDYQDWIMNDILLDSIYHLVSFKLNFHH